MVSETPVNAVMPYTDFLNRIIDDGQAEVRERFTEPDQKLRLDGCIDGFEACRGREVFEIVRLRNEARADCESARRSEDPRFWYYREREGQIEFTLATLSAAAHMQGEPTLTTVNYSHLRKALSLLAPEALAAAEAAGKA